MEKVANLALHLAETQVHDLPTLLYKTLPHFLFPPAPRSLSQLPVIGDPIFLAILA